jgi:hypothetical protein
MAVTCTLSNHYKYSKCKKLIDLSADTIKVCLMRSGFVFDKDVHAKKINFKNSSGVIANLSLDNTANTLTRGAGSFVTDGFVVGMRITTNSANGPNQGPFKISNVTALVLTVTTLAGGDPSLTTGAELNITVTGDDELASGAGYTQDTKTLAGASTVEDNVNDRAETTYNNLIWTATAGSIGPSPGALVYDDTSADDTIIGYIDFGGEQTAPDGADFTISNLKIREN